MATNTIPNTVTIKGTNCFQPDFHKAAKVEGLANLYPTINSTAANTENGIRLNYIGMAITENSKKNPCTIADNFDLPPD